MYISRKNQSYRLKKQTGLTLMETMIAIVIGILVLAAALGIYYVLSGETRVSKAFDETQEIVSASQQWRSHETSYANITMDNLCNEDLLSQDLCNSGYENPWGGTYAIAPTGTGNSEFQVTISDVPTGKDLSLANRLKETTVNESSAQASGGTVTATYR